jgi:hypothetical protein
LTILAAIAAMREKPIIIESWALSKSPSRAILRAAMGNGAVGYGRYALLPWI